jgi:hypothetical protein
LFPNNIPDGERIISGPDRQVLPPKMKNLLDGLRKVRFSVLGFQSAGNVVLDPLLGKGDSLGIGTV